MRRFAFMVFVSCAAGLVGLAYSQGGSRVSDGELLGTLKIINDGEIALGNTALTTSTNQDVKDFGQHMVQDHTAANQKIDQFVSSQHVSPSEGSLPIKFRADQAKDQAVDTVLRGAAFDRKYMQQMVDGHQKVLDMLGQQNTGRSSAMTQLLSSTKDTVSQHLQEAKLIQSKLGQ